MALKSLMQSRQRRAVIQIVFRAQCIADVHRMLKPWGQRAQKQRSDSRKHIAISLFGIAKM